MLFHYLSWCVWDSDPVFLSEQRARLTKNGFTQLFHRLCARAGLEDRHLTPTMLREMFAIRFLQTGGPPKALRRLLGLAACTPITRYLDAAGRSRRQREVAENQRKA
jgi:site-specific recombinase XerD